MGIIMKKNTRRGLIALLVLLIMVFGGLAVWWFIQPTQEAKKVPVYTCKQEAQLNYQVFVAPNNFFPQPVIGPGQAYLTSLTQYIETTLNYNLSANTPVNISGQYQVDAVLTGYILKEKEGGGAMERERVKVWEKLWPLHPPTPFAGQDSKLEMQQVVPVNIKGFADFADQVSQELKFAADVVELTVNYSVLGGATTPQGEIREPINVTMVIPVDSSYYTVGGMLTNQKEKSIDTTRMQAVPGVKTARMGYAIAAGVLVLLLLLVVLKTSAEIEDPEEKKLRKIIKKYGDRIVTGFSWVPAISESNLISLNSFDDLVKVADEVDQPIFYDDGPEGKHSFYVINAPLIYHYSLEIRIKKQITMDECVSLTNDHIVPDTKGIE
ncbi:MAG: DUF5305 family protein [Syntrophomonadaceae bacterium]|jgi:hypothetical protein